MGPLDPEPVEHGPDVVAGTVLRIARDVLRDVRGWIAPGVIGDAAVGPREVTELRLVAPGVARPFVDEHDRRARAHVLDVKADAVVSGDRRHRGDDAGSA